MIFQISVAYLIYTSQILYNKLYALRVKHTICPQYNMSHPFQLFIFVRRIVHSPSPRAINLRTAYLLHVVLLLSSLGQCFTYPFPHFSLTLMIFQYSFHHMVVYICISISETTPFHIRPKPSPGHKTVQRKNISLSPYLYTSLILPIILSF